MKRSLRVAFLVFAAMCGASAALSAHHNMSAIFDFNQRFSVTGTMTRLDWRNPHIELPS